MKKYISCSLVFSVLLCWLQVGVAETLSSRPVGVTTILLPAQSQYLASFSYSPLANPLLGVPTGTSQDIGFLRWDPVAQCYRSARVVNGKWQQDDSADTAVMPGDAFWVVNKQTADQVLMFGGLLNLSASNVTTELPGMNLIGRSYNQSAAVENSGRDFVADGQGHMVSNMVPGVGYWYSRREPGSKIWVEVSPVADTFPPEGSLPAISDVTVADGKVVLTIATSGGGKLDVYYRDKGATNALDLERDWKIAAQDIPVNGQETLIWTDSGPAIDEAGPSTRLYLVGNSSVLGLDGSPLCRSHYVAGKPLPSTVSGGQLLASSILPAPAGSQSTEATSRGKTRKGASCRIIYVDRAQGGDHLPGLSPVVVSGDGPKKTVSSGLQAAGNDGSTVIVKSGTYGETVNLSGKNVNVVIQGNVRL